MQKTPNYQDQFLAAARREKCIMTVFLMNGFQMKGCVRGFDSTSSCWRARASSR